uniref:Uncharacterized protein n=1 Tax=Arundo donax TaxID=35708 RepID=A0A0A8XW17_ARUDO
MKKNKKDKFY